MSEKYKIGQESSSIYREIKEEEKRSTSIEVSGAFIEHS
jgi:hypothetical protein